MPLDYFVMADEIEAALDKEWQRLKGVPMPGSSPVDRQVLFRAIARGVLQHLENRQAEIIRTITLEDSVGVQRTYTVTALDFNKAPNPATP